MLQLDRCELKQVFDQESRHFVPHSNQFKVVSRTFFGLARRLKFHPAFKGVEAEDLRVVYDEFSAHCERVLPGYDGHRLFEDFMYMWDVVETPHGAAIEAAVEAASCDPPREVLQHYPKGSPRARIAAVCMVLEKFNHGPAFSLSCRTLSRILHAAEKPLSHAKCALFLKKMVQDGVLEIHQEFKGRRDLATEYRLRLDAPKRAKPQIPSREHPDEDIPF